MSMVVGLYLLCAAGGLLCGWAVVTGLNDG